MAEKPESPKNKVLPWSAQFLQRQYSFGSSSGGGMDPDDKATAESFRTRSGSWNAWKLALLNSGVKRQKTVSESSDTSTVSGAEDINGKTKNYTVAAPPSPLIARTKAEIYSRRRQLSESKDTENLSFGQSKQVLYDIDGKFPYSYYEKKPTFYDIDGIHRYKHFQAFKPTPYTVAAPHHEKRPVIYDIDGKITCYTYKDIENAKQAGRFQVLKQSSVGNP